MSFCRLTNIVYELSPRRKVRVLRTKQIICFCLTIRKGGDAVMIWDCITSEGPAECKVVSGALNNDKYCETMEEMLIPFPQMLLGESYIQQQDIIRLSHSTDARQPGDGTMPKMLRCFRDQHAV